MASTILDVASTLIFIVLFGFLLRWVRKPGEAICAEIGQTLRSRGLDVEDITMDWAAGGDRSEFIYVVHARNPFGNVETHRFAVKRWAHVTSKNPTLREM